MSTALIAVGTYFLHRKQRAKAIRVALYFEILAHNIFELDPSPEGDPTFVVLGFSRASYDAYLDEIPDLLPEKLVGKISMYYSRVTTAVAQQQQIDDDTEKSMEATLTLIDVQTKQAHTTVPVDPDEVAVKELAGRRIGDRLSKMITQNRILLAVAVGQQEELLKTLRETFSYDPATEPVEVLPKYREWLTKVTAGALNKGNPNEQQQRRE